MSNNQALKQAYVATINQLNPRFTHAVTVTFKTRAYVLPKSYTKCTKNPNNVFVTAQKYQPESYKWTDKKVLGDWKWLNEEVAESTLDYFYAKLAFMAYGKDTKRTSTKAYSQPTMLTSIEGLISDKRIHAHLAIGNLPENIDIRNTIERAWWACDFAHHSIVIKPLSNTYGWLDYITKEANVGNVEALRIQSIKQPQIYLSNIGVENSL
ncbi:hypothetical protein M2128_000088 [Polynucleobacter sphagniphilus]|jgi:hypothetical protein|uniref:hypothetical protein n=1 Tax=Polynucleobacter sphagniphilus TaxID=1743169 RepID=UPI0024759DBD|nr:hypothetical protein [Polynucleobacter sphagniphilus]MDH6301186.1 hypothetical protein [Polynucleobacter sphagniphilus]